jgi:SEC-C motif-containing protein
MRSRYVAYIEQRLDYLRDTWHPETRPAQLDHDAETHWRHLQILPSTSARDGSSLDSGPDSDKATVHFRATFYVAASAGKQWGVLEEISQFVREAGRWLYYSGEVSHHSLKLGRNDPCPCGSGKKLKKCCAD